MGKRVYLSSGFSAMRLREKAPFQKSEQKRAQAGPAGNREKPKGAQRHDESGGKDLTW